MTKKHRISAVPKDFIQLQVLKTRVVSKKEVVKLIDIVKEADEKAFVIVTDAKEVLGEGFAVSSAR